MEIIKNNKLIAEFLGVQPNENKEYEMYGTIETINDGVDEKHFYTTDEMIFNSSWDWLMPVVEKIETLNNNGFDFDIFTEGVIITMYRKDNDADLNEGLEIIRNTRCEISFENKLEVCYISVIEFINWYSTKL